MPTAIGNDTCRALSSVGCLSGYWISSAVLGFLLGRVLLVMALVVDVAMLLMGLFMLCFEGVVLGLVWRWR